MEEKETITKEYSFTNLLQNSTDSTKSSIIPDSSDSEEDQGSVRRRLCLNRKLYKILAEKESEQKTNLSKTSSIDHSNGHIPSSNDILSKSKENFNDVISESMENKHLQTPKKHTTKKQQKNFIISDTDTDSSHSKYNSKESPRKEWVGPDIELNLKDLGLNKQLDPWIQSVQKKPAMSVVPVSLIL